jgi:rod shape-determining protein MreC
MTKRRRWRLSAAGWRQLALVALVLAHLIWVLKGRQGPTWWPRFLSTVSRPVCALSGHWEAWRTARSQRIRNLQHAEGEIQRLRADLDQARNFVQTQAPRLAESDEAVKLLGLKRILPLDVKAARVLVNVRKAPFGGMVVDQGWDAGLVPDQGVICPEGVVGRIWNVSEHQASLLPLDAYNSSTAVMLAHSRATGILQGVGPGRAEVRYVGNQEAVQVGEPVFTSGLDRVYPRGLLVGWVTEYQRQDVELRLIVGLAAPLDRVHLVLILPPRPEIELKPPGPPAAIHTRRESK